jgi:hypothetical protein
MSIPEDVLRERIRTELRDVSKLLDSAEQIADGLVGLLDQAYRMDGRTKAALAAANQLAVVLGVERNDAEDRAEAA